MIGTATDANFLKYELAYALAGETDFTVIGTGTSPVTNGVLGKLDPTLLDERPLRRCGSPSSTAPDNASDATVATVQVARDQKIGIFTLTFVDLDVPVSGVPITVTRTYDSRDKGQGDFGVGWRLDIQTRSVSVRTASRAAAGTSIKSGGELRPRLPDGEHKVSLTLPDGKVEDFDLSVTPTTSAFVPFDRP